MCKARFDSQGMILNGCQKNMAPFMANAIKNFHIFSTLPVTRQAQNPI